MGCRDIADVLSDFKPPDFMPVDLAGTDTPAVIDGNELLWAARVLASLVRVHRNVIPAVRENVKLAEAILGAMPACLTLIRGSSGGPLAGRRKPGQDLKRRTPRSRPATLAWLRV